MCRRAICEEDLSIMHFSQEEADTVVNTKLKGNKADSDDGE